MRSLNYMSIPILLLCLTTPSLAAKPKPPSKSATLLSSIRTLTFHRSRLTTARRTSPIPQLACVGGSASSHADVVETIQCKNSGSEYDPEDVSWTCTASLPEEFKLGGTEVVCEGYDSPEDPWVLRGSCGVEFRLVLTERGEERYGSGSGGGRWGADEESYLDGKSGGLGGKVFTFLFWAIFLGIVGLILYSIFFGPRADPNNPGVRRLGYNGGGGWGGGDDHDNDDPPPPYTPDYRKPDPRSSNNSSAWRPGFWSGTAAGAAAAYAMNQTRGGRNEQPHAQAGPSNWFGGGRQTAPRSGGFGGYGGGGSSSSPSPSSPRYESTGFGGTRRR